EITDTERSAREQIAIEWMRERIQEAGVEVDDHYEKYRLSDALMSMYKLIWDDFCSWFLEMIKPNYGDPISRKTQEESLALFEELMKMLHPFMPFLTEELYQRMDTRAAGDFICIAQQTQPKGSQAAILSEVELMKEAISSVRAFRAEKGLSPKEPIELYINTEQEALFQRFESVLIKFLNISKFEFVKEQQDGTASLRVQSHEFYIPLGSIDVEAEKAKIHKEIEYEEGFLEKVMKKLSNERFVNNAPEKVVALERKKKADAEARLETLRKSLAELG
ncbi:MAG: class I tRNA ligase family protein, partial [Bacteroidota bacterium]